MKKINYLNEGDLTLTITAGSLRKLSGFSEGSSANPEAQRGVIKAYTPKSLRRLKRTIQSVPHEINSNKLKMITLTYKGQPTHQQAKKDLDVFMKRLQRMYPDSFHIWKLEYQKRGAIHFHILSYNLPFVMPTWIAETWEAITQEGEDHKKAGTRIETIRKPQYIAKYVGKPVVSKKDDPGRYWGIRNKKAYDEAKDEKVIKVTKEEYLMMERVKRNYMDSYLKACGVKQHKVISERNTYTFLPLERMIQYNKDTHNNLTIKERSKCKKTIAPEQPEKRQIKPKPPIYHLKTPIKKEQLIIGPVPPLRTETRLLRPIGPLSI